MAAVAQAAAAAEGAQAAAALAGAVEEVRVAFNWKTSEVQAVVPGIAGVQPRDAVTTVKAVVQMGARVQRMQAAGQLGLHCTDDRKRVS